MLQDQTVSWHKKVRTLHGVWQGLCAQGMIPGRQQFDPAMVPTLLPNIWLIDVQRAPTRFRYRLTGSVIAAALGDKLVGRWLDEAHPLPPSSAVMLDLTAAVVDRQPRWFRGPSRLPHVARPSHEIECIVLPLATDGMTVDMLLCLSIFFDSQGHAIIPSRR